MVVLIKIQIFFLAAAGIYAYQGSEETEGLIPYNLEMRDKPTKTTNDSLSALLNSNNQGKKKVSLTPKELAHLIASSLIQSLIRPRMFSDSGNVQLDMGDENISADVMLDEREAEELIKEASDLDLLQ
ncbi:uncharacterized protein LOC126878958 [Diabrotica virgifera virgifera]|uniref:Uncharacterized protein LOC114339345 n=1 Tax=Diabrotica virgifera virgifera TaxID=50390 RepID=A0A6P7GKN5_DIAVI|nr:uncharacterized protein LOC126878958 [Diabrotica virgifera virgifera]